MVAMIPEIGNRPLRRLRRLRGGLLVLGMILLWTPPVAAQACPACDAAELARWLAGSFEMPVERADAEGKEDSDSSPEEQLVVVPIRVREMGQRVFYFERQRELSDGDPLEGKAPQAGERVVDSWLGLLETNEDSVVLKVYVFHDPERFIGAYSDKSRFRDLSWDDVRELRGEDTIWQRDGDAFVAERREEVPERSGDWVATLRRVTRHSLTVADPRDPSGALTHLRRIDS